MDFTALNIFKAVVDEGGIGAAAKKLHRVQSNVTARIKQLEASLGAQLFVRENRRLHLSPAGRLFLGHAERILRISEQARSELAGAEPRGVLRVGALESIAASRLPPLLSRYHRKHPAVRIELSTGTNDALIDALVARNLEAAFVAERLQGDRLEFVPAFREELVLIAPLTHPKVRHAQDLRHDTLIAFPVGCAYRRRLQAWLSASRLSPGRIMELGSYHSIVACVASGAGIALVPRSVLDTVRGPSDIALYPLAAGAGSVTTAFAWRRNEATPAVRAMQAEVAARKTPSGP